MKVIRTHLDLISRIYDTALDPSVWTDILDGVAMQCGAHGSALGMADMTSPEVHIQKTSSVYSRDVMEEYDHRFQAEDREAYQNLFRYPAHRMISDTDLFSGDIPARELPAQKFLIEHFGIAHRAAARLNRDGAWIGVMTLQHHERHGPMTAAEADIADLFLPHLAKAAELSRPFMVLKSRFHAVMAALDRFHIGVFILSAAGEVILRNHEAERILDLKDGLSLDRVGRTLPAGEAERHALREAIAKAAATALAEDDRAETLLVLPRRSQGDPFLVEVAPIRSSGVELDHGFAGAMMFAIDPMRTDVVSTEGMRALYNLTGTESEICRLIVEGLGTREVAEARNVGQETVRTHVKRLLEKTGTQNRAQLVRLALSVNLPIDKVDGDAEEG